MPTIRDSYLFDDLDNSTFKASRNIINGFEEQFIKEAQAETGTITIDQKIDAKMKDFKGYMSNILNYMDEIIAFVGYEEKTGAGMKRRMRGGARDFHYKKLNSFFDKIKSLEGDRHYDELRDGRTYLPTNIMYGGANTPPESEEEDETVIDEATLGQALDDEDAPKTKIKVPSSPIVSARPDDDGDFRTKLRQAKNVFMDMPIKIKQKITGSKSTSAGALNKLIQDHLNLATSNEGLQIQLQVYTDIIDRLPLGDRTIALSSFDKFVAPESSPTVKYEIDPDDIYTKTASKYNPLLQTITKINNITDKATSDIKGMLQYSSKLDLEDTEEIKAVMSIINERIKTLIKIMGLEKALDPATIRSMQNMISKINALLTMCKKLTGFYTFDITPAKDIIQFVQNAPSDAEIEKRIEETQRDLEFFRQGLQKQEQERIKRNFDGYIQEMVKNHYELNDGAVIQVAEDLLDYITQEMKLKKSGADEIIAVVRDIESLRDALLQQIEERSKIRAEAESGTVSGDFKTYYAERIGALENTIGNSEFVYNSNLQAENPEFGGLTEAMRKRIIANQKDKIPQLEELEEQNNVVFEPKTKKEKSMVSEFSKLLLYKLALDEELESLKEDFETKAQSRAEARKAESKSKPKSTLPSGVRSEKISRVFSPIVFNTAPNRAEFESLPNNKEKGSYLKEKYGFSGQLSQLNASELKYFFNEYEKEYAIRNPPAGAEESKEGSGIKKGKGVSLHITMDQMQKAQRGGGRGKGKKKGGALPVYLDSGRFTPAQMEIITKYLL
jgi:hypothetical protein